ncbi:hypothetical protein PH210_05385 [Paenibacillus sp. BSR1-1]|uniref:hypothetical protein n=1 Tax=Paenibacillus sp. BSR1-1 TaxID=3020845 RepID=UPI0025B02686|nr:hypothetical protein [Paenibacillus sp. BSR1-1]MDN3015641.1 hypothetical protein [Paenibacillus sp. BSR1-1]
MQSYEVKWMNKGTTGTMVVKWWIDNGRVKVKLYGEIPDVFDLDNKYLSKRSLIEFYELIYAYEIEKRFNELGYDPNY